MSSTKDSVINTDLNILSETRYFFSLYARGSKTLDPYLYINATEKMDILPFLAPEQAREQMFEMGKNFLGWNGFQKTVLIANQLKKIDPVWGSSLVHEMLFWRHDNVQATMLYESQAEWIDITHYRQFLIYLQDKNWRASKAIILKIRSDALRQLANIRFHYENKDWASVGFFKPITQLSLNWILMARLQQKDYRVLNQLLNSIEVKYENLEALQLMSKILNENSDIVRAKIIDSQLMVLINARINFYASQSLIARQENNMSWGKELNKEINYLTDLTDRMINFL